MQELQRLSPASARRSIAARLFDARVMLGVGDLPEKSLRRGPVLSGGDVTPFVTRPISATLIALVVLSRLVRWRTP